MRRTLKRKQESFMACCLVLLISCTYTLPVRAQDSPTLPRATSTGTEVVPALGASWIAEEARIVCVDVVPVNSELSEPTRAVWKVPAGSLVKAGQVIAQLDTTAILDRTRKAELALAKAQMELGQIEQPSKIHQLEREREVAAARTALQLAKLDQQIYQQGESKQTQRALERTLNLAVEKLQHAQIRLSGSQRLADRGYLSIHALKADQLVLVRAQAERDSALHRQEIFRSLGHPRRKLEIETQLAAAKAVLEQVQRKAREADSKMQSLHEQHQTKYQSAKAQLDLLRNELKRCQIKGPCQGVVLDVDSDAGLKTKVQPGQTILRIGQLDRLGASLRLVGQHGTRLQVDQPATISVDLLPNRVFYGRVLHVSLESTAPAPTPQQEPIYDVLVEFYNPSQRIWPKMPAHVQINLEPGTSAEGTEPQIASAIVGALVGTVVERAEVDGMSDSMVRSQVNNPSTIHNIIDNGTKVSQGQVVAELISPPLHRKYVEYASSVRQAVQAIQESELRLSEHAVEANRKMALTQKALKIAQLQLDEYRSGDYVQARETIESRIAKLQMELDVYQRRVTWSERVTRKGYITKTELMSDRLAYKEKQSELEIAQDQLHHLKMFTRRRQMAELQARVQAAEEEIDRQKQIANAERSQLTAAFRILQIELEAHRQAFSEIEQQVAHCTIRAPHAGTIVLAQRESDHAKSTIRDGTPVRKNQTLLFVSKPEPMRADIRLHRSLMMESSLDGSVPIRIRPIAAVDAGREIVQANVTDASLQTQLESEQTPRMIVEIEPQVLPNLLIQRTAIVELGVRLKNVLYVPTNAIVRDGNDSYCIIDTATGYKKRDVVAGLEVGEHTEVKEGIEQGTRVVVNPYLPLVKVE